MGGISSGIWALLAAVAAGGLALAGRRWWQHAADHARMTAELQESERRFRFIAEHSGDVIWTMDVASGRFTYVSPAVFQLRGYTAEEIMAEPALAAVTAESAARIKAVLADSIARWHAGERTDTRRVTEVDQPHKDGHIVATEVVTTLHGDDRGPQSVLGITRDITERKRAEEEVRNQAFIDPLTQLPNRRLLLDRLNRAVAMAGREPVRLALMFIDLDHFKQVNDQFGHDTGDWLLRTVAKRMSDSVRHADTVARLGGDEFVILLSSVRDDDDALLVAEKIRRALGESFTPPTGPALHVSSSIGVAVYPDHGQNERLLLKAADEAMYQAKAAGRNQVRLAAGRVAPSSAGGDDALLRFHWRSAYECGLPAIDREHRTLFDNANDLLRTALERERDPAGFMAAVDQLLSNVQQHFSNEEALLQRIAYPDLVAHARRHRELVLQATHLREEARAGRISVGDWVDFVANDVVVGHLIREDRKFFPLLALATTNSIAADSDAA